MSGNIDILLRLPDVATIGRVKLQNYCDGWLKRPIASNLGISHLIVGSDLMLTANLDTARIEFVDGRTFVPICELLDYVIDQHFQDAAKRRELHAEARDIWKRWGEIGYSYEAMAGRIGPLYIACKSCAAELETHQLAVEGQSIVCPPCQRTCPACGATNTYDGSDLHLRFIDQT